MTRIDTETAAKIRSIMGLCLKKGADPVEVLDRAGLLDYAAKREERRIETIDALIQSLRQVTAEHMPEARTTMTPLDRKNYVVTYLEMVRDGLIKKGK